MAALLLLLLPIAATYGASTRGGILATSTTNTTNTTNTTMRKIVATGPFGGGGGSEEWSDGELAAAEGGLTAIRVTTLEASGWRLVQSIQAKYGHKWGEQHGSDGEEETFKLHGAHIIVVQLWSGDFIDGIEFITDQGDVFGPYGGTGGQVEVSSVPGCLLAHLSGTSGELLDSLTLHWIC